MLPIYRNAFKGVSGASWRRSSPPRQIDYETSCGICNPQKKGVDIVISLDDNHILPHNKIWEIFARKDFIPYFLQKKETASSHLFLLINLPHTLEESTLGSHSQDVDSAFSLQKYGQVRWIIQVLFLLYLTGFLLLHILF